MLWAQQCIMGVMEKMIQSNNDQLTFHFFFFFYLFSIRCYSIPSRSKEKWSHVPLLRWCLCPCVCVCCALRTRLLRTRLLRMRLLRMRDRRWSVRLGYACVRVMRAYFACYSWLFVCWRMLFDRMVYPALCHEDFASFLKDIFIWC